MRLSTHAQIALIFIMGAVLFLSCGIWGGDIDLRHMADAYLP